jgi:hypothetical protein
MLITKTNPSGINFYVQKLQTMLHTRLLEEWGLDTSKWKCYGLCYRNKKDNGYIAENFDPSAQAPNDYKEVYWDDTFTVVSFFGLSNQPVSLGVMNEVNVHLVFFANLTELALEDKAGNVIAHRADEELRNSVLSVLGKSSFGFSVESVELWLENVLKEYPGNYRDEQLKVVDMHPKHCFRINLKLTYNPNKNC